MKLFFALGLVLSPEQEPRKSVRYIKNAVLMLLFVIGVMLIGYVSLVIRAKGSPAVKIGIFIVYVIIAVPSIAYCISNVRKECAKDCN